MKRLLFITSANLTVKPRLVKEIVRAKEKFDVSLLSVEGSQWTEKYHDKIVQELGLRNFKVRRGGRYSFQWILVTIIYKLCFLIWPFLSSSLVVNAFASSRQTILLYFYLLSRPSISNYNLAAGRNTATLYILFAFRKRWNSKFGFDIEDFHPGERITWTKAGDESRRRSFLMKRICSRAEYLSAASPLIAEKTVKEILGRKGPEIIHIRNSELKGYYSEEVTEPDKLSIVWFSIDILPHRGLEKAIEAIKLHSDNIVLHLIGNMNPDFRKSHVDSNSFIRHWGVLPPEEIKTVISGFDVGIALESGSVDHNREICWTNKIFSYAQCGLFILATKTRGQQLFFDTYKIDGRLIECDLRDINPAIVELLERKNEIRIGRKSRFDNCKAMNWEHDGELIMSTWTKILGEGVA